MGQNPVLFYKVFPNRDKMPLEVPQSGGLLPNVTAVTCPKNRDICTFKMAWFAWVRFQQQLPCNWLCVNETQPAAKIMLRGPKKLKWGLLSTWLTFLVSLIKTHPAWFQLSLISASWLTFFSHHQNELAEKCRQNPLYIWRFSESTCMRPIWWQSPSISI